ncbi:MAG TPA: hypothetical protein VF087_10445 [Solirubrobacteraceae bacterium]
MVARQAKAEKACQTAYAATLQSIQAQIDALDPNAPDYDAQRSALEAQQTAAGRAAGLPEEGTEQLGMTTGGAAWRWAPLLAAVAVAVAWRGGYTDDARGVVAALAGLAALAAVAAAPEAAGRATRHPLVLILAALAALTALTAAWTTGVASDAARDAAAILALCALVVAAASVPAPGAHAGVCAPCPERWRRGCW